MIFLLSPAKLMRSHTSPSIPKLVLKKESFILMKHLRLWSLPQVQQRMKLSEDKAIESFRAIQNWGKKANERQSAPALFAYIGEAFKALDADSMNPIELDYLQEKLCILSGLYGVLSAQTRVEPYRLEMAQAGLLPDGQSLYSFWKKPIRDFLNKTLSKEEFIINLASAEYSKVVEDPKLRARMITPQFLELNNGKPKAVSVFSKQARGTMLRWCAQIQLQDSEQLKSFDLLGYRFDEAGSTTNEWVFIR
ncbi:MAG: YaaA family protein [Sphingomonadales bacterium]